MELALAKEIQPAAVACLDCIRCSDHCCSISDAAWSRHTDECQLCIPTDGDLHPCAASAGDAASAAVLLGGVPGLEPAPTRCGHAPPPPLQPEARLAAISNALSQAASGQETSGDQKVPKLLRPRSVLRPHGLPKQSI